MARQKRLMVAAGVLAFLAIFVPATIVAASAGMQSAFLVDELPAPASGTPSSVELDHQYVLFFGGGLIAVIALIISITLLVVALNRPVKELTA